VPQVESPKRANGLWFKGVCDELYLKIAAWDKAYWFGMVHSTRKWLDPANGQVIDKPTKMAHEIPFREVELEHLSRIANELRSGSQLAEELKNLCVLWQHGRAVKGHKFSKGYWAAISLPPGLHRVITVAFYPEHVKDILYLLDEARGDSVRRAEGKELFET